MKKGKISYSRNAPYPEKLVKMIPINNSVVDIRAALANTTNSCP